MTETLSALPSFSSGDVIFRCFARTDDDGTSRYVWRSECRRFVVWRAGAGCMAVRDQQIIGRDYPTLGKAMIAAQFMNLERVAA